MEEAHASEVQQEAAKIRRLQIMISMVMSVISQDPNLTIEEASELVAGTKRAALAMFPGQRIGLRHSVQATAAAADAGEISAAISRRTSYPIGLAIVT